jgi:hypothetical protein
MKTFWADITVKVTANTLDEAEAILYDTAHQAAQIYEGQIAVKEINVEDEV